MDIALLLSGILFGVLTIRAMVIVDKDLIGPTSAMVLCINSGAIMSTFGIIIWGFINLNWWATLAGLMAVYVLVEFIVCKTDRVLFYRSIPITGIITIAITIGIYCS